MQSLEIISVNLWNILISLANLLILYVVIKKFLYAPVKRVLAERQSQIDESYAKASQAEQAALESKAEWECKMLTARSEADEIIQTAKTNASKRAEKIVTEASERAEEIVRQAELDASLELERAQQDIKYQIVNVSAALAEKMLAREINTSDHRELIDSVIDNIGENDGADV